jgi:hypothetical protein
LPIFERATAKFTSRRGKKIPADLADAKLDLNYRDDENFAVDAVFPFPASRLFPPVAPYAYF